MRLDVLRKRWPGIEVQERPHRFSVVVEGGGVFPLSMSGGIGFVAWPLKRLRLSARCGLGLTDVNREPVTSHFAEALLGHELSGRTDPVTVSLPFRKRESIGTDLGLPTRANVPIYRGFLLEGGAMTHLAAWYACPCDCEDDWSLPENAAGHSKQVVLGVLGARFIYFRYLRSKRLRDYWSLNVDVFAHTLFGPIGPSPPESAIYTRRGDAAPSSGAGEPASSSKGVCASWA